MEKMDAIYSIKEEYKNMKDTQIVNLLEKKAYPCYSDEFTERNVNLIRKIWAEETAGEK